MRHTIYVKEYQLTNMIQHSVSVPEGLSTESYVIDMIKPLWMDIQVLIYNEDATRSNLKMFFLARMYLVLLIFISHPSGFVLSDYLNQTCVFIILLCMKSWWPGSPGQAIHLQIWWPVFFFCLRSVISFITVNNILHSTKPFGKAIYSIQYTDKYKLINKQNKHQFYIWNCFLKKVYFINYCYWHI